MAPSGEERSGDVMRWLTFLLLVGVALIAQSALAPRFELLGARCDWLLVVVVFFALTAKPFDAVTGAWIVGACADLLTIERSGLIAMTYMGAALLIVSIREYLFRDGFLTRFVVTGVVCMIVRLAWILYARVAYGPSQSFVVDIWHYVLMDALYTACWAPLVHALLRGFSRTLGVSSPRYAYAGLRGA